LKEKNPHRFERVRIQLSVMDLVPPTGSANWLVSHYPCGVWCLPIQNTVFSTVFSFGVLLATGFELLLARVIAKGLSAINRCSFIDKRKLASVNLISGNLLTHPRREKNLPPGKGVIS